MTRFLVVGGRGFIGRRVLGALRSDEAAIGTTRRHLDGLQHVEAADPGDLSEALDALKPDVVVNAAGLLAGSTDDLHDANVTLVARLLDEVAARGLRFVHVGSAAELGDPGGASPVDELAVCRPVNDYGRSKLEATELVLAAHEAGHHATVARVFNTVGPSQHPAQPVGDVVRRIRDLPASGGTITVGNAEVVRDFVDVDFVAKAVAALAHLDAPPALVNVCSGIGHSVRELVEALLAVQQVTADIIDLREPAIASVVGDPNRLEQLTGLHAAVMLEDLARAGSADQRPGAST